MEDKLVNKIFKCLIRFLIEVIVRPLIQAELTPLYIAGLPHHIYLKKQK